MIRKKKKCTQYCVSAILGSKCEIPSQLNKMLSEGSEMFSHDFFRQFPY